MTRRWWLPTTVVTVLLLPTLFAALAPAGDRTADAATTPNIIMIVTDDQEVDSLQYMPQVRRHLVRKGTSFSNFYVTTPGCCPSRSSIFRGQFVHNHEVYRGSGPNGGHDKFMPLESSTVAVWLRRAGYRNALVGKYLNGYGSTESQRYVPPGWSRWYANNSKAYFDYEMIHNGKVVQYGDEPEDYLNDVLTGLSQRFIKKESKTRRPFFLYLAPRAPHGPATPAPRHADTFSDVQAPRGGSFNEDDVSDKPDYVRNEPPLSNAEITELDALYRDRLRTLAAVDEMVGDLIKTLRQSGELDNTYIFFLGDNGYLLGQHRRIAKGVPYDEAIKQPLIVRGPGVPAGRTVNELVLNIDLAPTLTALAGTRPAGFVDGRSLVPLFQRRKPNTWRQAALIEGFRGNTQDAGEFTATAIEGLDKGGVVPGYFAIRTQNRLYVEYATGERELYDMKTDPYQLVNVIDDPAYASEIDALADRLTELKPCAGDACRQAEEAPLTRST